MRKAVPMQQYARIGTLPSRNAFFVAYATARKTAIALSARRRVGESFLDSWERTKEEGPGLACRDNHDPEYGMLIHLVC